MDEKLVSLVRKQNAFLKLLLKSQALWEDLREDTANLRVPLEEASPQVQRFQSMFGLSDYYVMLPRFADFAQKFGGMEQFLHEFKPESKAKGKANSS